MQNLVKEICRLMRNEAVLKEINLELTCEDGDFTILGDEGHLKQVLVNLVKNAIEATSKNGRISFSLKQKDNNTALITVRDNGTGIKPEHMDKIGTPFFTTKPSGTGLGLSVSKRIIEEHSGTFDIVSKQGKGTTIMIELPLSSEDASGKPD